MKPNLHSTLVLALLTILVTGVATVSVIYRWASLLEAFCFATGAICVWLVVRENIWNFPIGILNVTGYSIVFYQAGLYADAGLQVVYFVLGCVGWSMWWRGSSTKRDAIATETYIGRVGATEFAVLAMLVLAATVGLWRTLYLVGGSASFWDALTTAISLASQWMLNRKQLESWIGWIVVDCIYVPLYLYKELYLTSLLYAVFLCMAIIGLFEWHRSWNKQQTNQP